MKKAILFFCNGLSILFISLSGCDPGHKPNIAFKTGASYISGDATVSKSDTLTIGITASKAEAQDVLKNQSVIQKRSTLFCMGHGSVQLAITKFSFEFFIQFF